MTEKEHDEILNISRTVFYESEYIYIKTCLKKKSYNNLKLFASQKIDFLDAIIKLEGYNDVTNSQINLCHRLDEIINKYIPVKNAN
jgi:hypothetical protein